MSVLQDNITEGEIRIDPKHHRHFVARRGGVLHRIADECGGVQISFPRAGVDSDRVILKGSHECIEAAKQRMREIVQELVNFVTFFFISFRNYFMNKLYVLLFFRNQW